MSVLDEGDMARRASRANFALIWVQGKGIGMSRYASWSMESAAAWPAFAAGLADVTGIDVALWQPGGFNVCMSEEELETRAAALRALQAQPGAPQYPWEVLNHDEAAWRLPGLGPDVAGAIYSPIDGHVNSLRLFGALHRAMARLGVDYRAEHAVDTMTHNADGFLIRGSWGEMRSHKVVVAAGLDTQRLAATVGMHVPVKPSKGQVIVTEKLAPFLHAPILTLRQTDEGGVMIGDSQEEMGFDDQVTVPIISVMAARAVRMFPALAGVNIVRTWSASRVMTPDGFPVYVASHECPGAYAAVTHSGVTLAAAHAGILCDHLLAGAFPSDMSPFNLRRLDVSTAA